MRTTGRGKPRPYRSCGDPEAETSGNSVIEHQSQISNMTAKSNDLIACPGCGARFPEQHGPTHRYLESTPGCWAAYGEVLAREYSDPAYMKVHHFTADAYPVQHPGKPSKHNMQSVIVHLIGLYAGIELGLSQQEIAILRDGATTHIELRWLEPPQNRGNLTVADIVPARAAEEHCRLVYQWAEEAWEAWTGYHDQVKQWTQIIRQAKENS